MSDLKIYLVAMTKPDTSQHFVPRYTLEDAHEVKDKHDTRFPKIQVHIWKVERDGSVTAVSSPT